MTKYQKLLKKLFSINLEKKMRFGLERCFHLHDALGRPANNFDCVHVAGTNGKGSVCAKVSAALQASGLRVGTFTSPHIATFRERICVDGVMISEEETEAILRKIMGLNQEATFFEIVTLLALCYFAEKGVDIAVLETGMGGRLDATNIVTPLVSVITSISLEHTQYLGDTIEKIAQEKAGIIKPGVPVVIGPHVPEKEIVAKITSQLGSVDQLLHRVAGAYQSYDDENSAIARRTLEILKVSEKNIEQGLKVIPPCRFEEVTCPRTGVPVVLDVGHNPNGIVRLFQRLSQVHPGRQYRVLVGISKGKDVAETFKIILHHCKHVHLVEAVNERGFPVDELFEELQTLGLNTEGCRAHHSIKEGLVQALDQAAEAGEVVVVCGSFFIMDAVRRGLGFDEPYDFTDMNEKM